MDMTHIARRMPQKYFGKGGQAISFDMNSECGWICLWTVVNSEAWLRESHSQAIIILKKRWRC